MQRINLINQQKFHRQSIGNTTEVQMGRRDYCVVAGCGNKRHGGERCVTVKQKQLPRRVLEKRRS